jgi:hypothetical protein
LFLWFSLSGGVNNLSSNSLVLAQLSKF